MVSMFRSAAVKTAPFLLHLARELYPDIKAAFIDTGLERPEVREFVRLERCRLDKAAEKL